MTVERLAGVPDDDGRRRYSDAWFTAAAKHKAGDRAARLHVLAFGGELRVQR